MKLKFKAQDLIQRGFKVRGRHIRRLRDGVFNPEIGTVDNFLSRGEFRVLAPKDKSFIKSHGEDVQFGDVVESRGGFTQYTIISPDGREFTAKFQFKDKQFVKKTGSNIAFGLALQKVAQAGLV